MDLFENFWSEKFWLPEGIGWKDIEPGSRNGIVFRHYNDLLWSIPLAILITIVKSIVIRYCFTPFGEYLQIKATKAKPPPNNVALEKLYQKSQKLPSEMQMASLAKQTDLTKREIERWWRKRRAQNKATTLDKFCDNCWRCTFYLVNFTMGLSVLWDKPWLWNFFDMFRDYPNHSIDNGIWWYYNIAMAFYLSLSFTHFFETRRKDFWQMFIHHVITLTLFIASWTVNGVRAGSLIVFVHDIADVLLEAGKAAKYAKADRTCSAIFVVFVVVWIVTRLVIFARIVHCGIAEFPSIHPRYPLYYVLAALNIFLLILHLLWTYMIFQVASRLIHTSAVDDVRSSAEDSDDCGSDSDSSGSEKVGEINGNIETKSNGVNGHAKH